MNVINVPLIHTEIVNNLVPLPLHLIIGFGIMHYTNI
jgi:hypothetical protein